MYSLLEEKNFIVFFISSSYLDLWVIHTFFILDIDLKDGKQENNNELVNSLLFLSESFESLDLPPKGGKSGSSFKFWTTTIVGISSMVGSYCFLGLGPMESAIVTEGLFFPLF